MFAIFAFVNAEFFGEVVIVFGYFGSSLSLFASFIANLMLVTHPTTLWFVNFIKICIFGHIIAIIPQIDKKVNSAS